MAKRGVRGGGLGRLSMAELQREIKRRHRAMTGLVRTRNRLAARVAQMDRDIRSMGAVGGGGSAPGLTAAGLPRKRAKNAMNLVQSLAKVLKSKTMSVTDVAQAVQSAGYKTTAANFRTIVNQTLIKYPRTFKKMSRGMYTAA